MKFPWSHTTIVDMIKNDHKAEEKCHKVTADIIAGILTIAEFVEELGPALTHTDASVRAQGTLLLSNVLKDLPPEGLTGEQLEFVSAFYCDRAKDHNAVTPMVLVGMEALSRMTNLSDAAAVRLLRSLFELIPCQSQKKPERTMYFQTIVTLSERKTDALKEWGADFIYGVIGAMEGERDPRNLLYLFEQMPTFIRAYPMHHLVEEMFETFACYFPIDFHPNPNDPVPITRDTLAEKLADCLCATAEMAVFAIPLLLEKLDSSLNVAKLDSLALLGRCLAVLDVKEVEQHHAELWSALKRELFPTGPSSSTDKTLQEAGYAAMQALAKNASTDESSAKTFLDQILVGVMGSLTDASSKNFEASLQVELACARASSYCAVYVIEKLVPMLLAQLNVDGFVEMRLQNILVDSLQRLMIPCAQWYCWAELDPTLLGQVQKKFIEILLQQPNASEQKRSALKALAAVPEMVTSENRYVVYNTIVNDLLASVDKVPQTDAVEDCLYSFATRNQQEVKTVVLNKLITHDYATTEQAVIQRTFKALGKLILYHGYMEKMIDFFLSLVFAKPPSVDDRLAIVAMDTLTDVVETGNHSQLAKAELYVQYKLLDRFFEYATDQLTSDYLYSMSRLIAAVVKQLPTDEQKDLILKRLPTLQLQRRSHLYLASGLLGYLDESVPLVDHFESLVNDLSKLALETDDERVRQVCHHLLCSLFNRMPDDDHHRGVLKRLLAVFKTEVKKHNHQAVVILGWIGKGLIARGHAEAGEIIDDVAELLDHPTLGHIAALAFEILSLEFPQLHLPLLKSLFKQKLFVWVMKKLEGKMEQYAVTHLKALVFVFKATPHAVLKMNLSKVGPVLLKCLAQDDDHTMVEALTMVGRLIRELDVFVQDHLQSLIPVLLKLATRESSMKVRIGSLESLLYICKYPTFLLLPFKQTALIELQKPLDDRKRLVRNAAVAARLQWYLVGSTEEAKDDK